MKTQGIPFRHAVEILPGLRRVGTATLLPSPVAPDLDDARAGGPYFALFRGNLIFTRRQTSSSGISVFSFRRFSIIRQKATFVDHQ